MERVLPLVAKHGAAVVAISNDETGISEDPDVRFSVAQRIVHRAADHGIPSQRHRGRPARDAHRGHGDGGPAGVPPRPAAARGARRQHDLRGEQRQLRPAQPAPHHRHVPGHGHRRRDDVGHHEPAPPRGEADDHGRRRAGRPRRALRRLDPGLPGPGWRDATERPPAAGAGAGPPAGRSPPHDHAHPRPSTSAPGRSGQRQLRADPAEEPRGPAAAAPVGGQGVGDLLADEGRRRHPGGGRPPAGRRPRAPRRTSPPAWSATGPTWPSSSRCPGRPASTEWFVVAGDAPEPAGRYDGGLPLLRDLFELDARARLGRRARLPGRSHASSTARTVTPGPARQAGACWSTPACADGCRPSSASTRPSSGRGCRRNGRPG